jgi:hypothetical protein
MIFCTTFCFFAGGGASSSFEHPVPKIIMATPIEIRGTKPFMTPPSVVEKQPLASTESLKSNPLEAIHIFLLKLKNTHLTIKISKPKALKSIG